MRLSIRRRMTCAAAGRGAMQARRNLCGVRIMRGVHNALGVCRGIMRPGICWRVTCAEWAQANGIPLAALGFKPFALLLEICWPGL